MSNRVIQVNFANVKAAHQRIQNSRGAVRLGSEAVFSLGLIPVLGALEAEGHFRRACLAKCLNDRGLVTSAGKRWGPVTVDRLMAQLADVIRTSAWAETS
jgi:hypothetical protein